MSDYEWDNKLRSGYNFDEVSSAMQKSIRRGLEFEAFFWALELCENGFDLYCWKRLQIIAVEDIGLADTSVPVLVNSLAQMWEKMRKTEKGVVKLPETNILSLAIVKMCRSQKNRNADDLACLMSYERSGRDCKTGKYDKTKLTLEVPPFAKDGHTKVGKDELKKKYLNNWYDMWNKEFYEGVARCNNPTEIPNEINWSKILMEKVGCDYEEYMNPIKNDKEDEQK